MLLSLCTVFHLVMISFSCIIRGVVNDYCSDFLFKIRLKEFMSLTPHVVFMAVISYAMLFIKHLHGIDTPVLH